MEHIRNEIERIEFGCTEMAHSCPFQWVWPIVANAVEGIQTTQTFEWKSFWYEQNKTIRKKRAMDFSYFGALFKEEKFHFEDFKISVVIFGSFLFSFSFFLLSDKKKWL